MAKLADATDLKSVGLRALGVQVPPGTFFMKYKITIAVGNRPEYRKKMNFWVDSFDDFYEIWDFILCNTSIVYFAVNDKKSEYYPCGTKEEIKKYFA